MLRIGVGSSDDVDGTSAAQSAFERAARQLEGLTPKAAVLFCGVDVDTSEVLRVMAARLPGVPLVGGTTAAEVSGTDGATEGLVNLVLFAGDMLEAGAGHFALGGSDHPDDAVERARAAQLAVAQASKPLNSPPRLCLCFGISARGPADLHAALVQALGTEVPVIGGGVVRSVLPEIHGEAFFGEQNLQEAAAMLLLAGDFQVTHAVGHGFRPIGEPHTITRALKGGVLIEVDGQPALDLYRDYLGLPGDGAMMFVHHPMLIQTAEGHLLRGAVGQGPSPGSLMLAGAVDEGSRMQLCEFDRESLLAATATATTEALAHWRGPPPTAALVFECLTRWFALGTWAPRSLDRLRDSLPAGTVIAGAYVGGEFAPFARGGRTQLHNCSVVILLIGESAP
jgi:hypothetical protein